MGVKCMKILGVLLSGLVLTYLMSYLTASSTGKPVKYKIGKIKYYVLRYNKIIETIGIASLVLVGIIVTITWIGIAEIDTRGNLIAFICLVLGFTLMGITFVLIYRNIKVEVSEEKIKYWNLFGRTKEISWNEITTVKCVGNGKTIKLITDKNSISVDTQMEGFLTFNMLMTKKLDRSIYLDAIKKDASYIICKRRK